MSNDKILALILAAGEGKRMKSDSCKVLQPLAGKALILHLIDSLQQLTSTPNIAIVHGHRGAQLQEALQTLTPSPIWIKQQRQLGTGDAVRTALDVIANFDITLILLGDTPLVSVKTLEHLLAAAAVDGFSLLATRLEDPSGYGRLILNEKQQLDAIVEDRDANAAQRKIKEVNCGMMAINKRYLQQYLPLLSNDNAQGEYYLTEIVELMRRDNRVINVIFAADSDEVLGINDRFQLAHAENVYRNIKARQLLAAGATLLDPKRIDIHGELTVGKDVIIEANVVFKGKVQLGDRVTVESSSVIIDSTIAADCIIRSHSHIEGAQIGSNSNIGPFARIRPKTVLCNATRVGNFVEIKAATIAANSKINHLSYIGDAHLGANVNIGAGTITCNYDGNNKHQTTIGDNVFIGSNSSLIAPITIGNNSTIGAGSALGGNIASDCLSFTRAALTTKNNWRRPSKITIKND